MNGVYLGIGGNEGNRLLYLEKAKELIREEIAPIAKESSIYKTAAWGEENQPDFYNQVIYLKTELGAQECLKKCLSIEKKLGRKRQHKWSSRTIDIDILFYGSKIISRSNLKIPHPHLHERNFVLVPMHEIAPHFVHPVFRKKIFTLLKECTDNLDVKRIGQ